MPITVVSLDTPALQRFGRNGTGGSDHFRRLLLTSGPGIVTPKIEMPPGALPVRTAGGDWDGYAAHDFANSQDLFHQFGESASKPDSGFNEVHGVVTVGIDGAFLQTGGLSGDFPPGAGAFFRFGTRFHWEEGVFRVTAPFVDGCAFGFHKDANPRGQLILVEVAGAVRFRYRQANEAGTAIEEFDFDQLTVPVGGIGPNDTAIYCYYNFSKEWNTATSTGQIRLYLKTPTSSASQTIVLTHDPQAGADMDFDSLINCGLGNPDPPPAGSFRNFFVLWYRAVGHDTTEAFTGGTEWTDAKIHETETFETHGNEAVTWLDSGAAGQFWSFPFFFFLLNEQGSKVEGRFKAVDVKPAGALGNAFFDPELWFEFIPGQLTQIGTRQGRYFGTQFRFTPSPTVGLGGFTSLLQEVGQQLIYSAGWSPVSGSASPAQVLLGGERPSEDTLPVAPHYVADTDHRFQTARSAMDSGDVTTFRLSTSSRRRWNIGWGAITEAQYDALRGFFKVRRFGEGTFTAPRPEGGTAKVSIASREIAWQRLAPNAYATQIEVEEVLV